MAKTVTAWLAQMRPTRVVRRAQRDVHRLVVHLERLRVRGAESGGVGRADRERERPSARHIDPACRHSRHHPASTSGPDTAATARYSELPTDRAAEWLPIDRGHAAHAGRIRGRDRQRPRVTRGVPNPFPGTGLEPEVVGSLRGQVWACGLARRQPDRGEIDPAGAGAGCGSAFHLIAPSTDWREPGRPCWSARSAMRATAVEVGVPDPSGTVADRRRCPSPSRS